MEALMSEETGTVPPITPDFPVMEMEKVRQDAKVVKIGTIISEFADDGEYDIPTFIRQQQQTM